jgi:hypothetical protein
MSAVRVASDAVDGAQTRAILLPLRETDLELMIASIRTVLREIDPPEFHTRLGETVDTARRVLADLLALMNDAGPQAKMDVAWSLDELLFVKNALNEVLNGLGAQDVVDRFGADGISSMMREMRARLRASRAPVSDVVTSPGA